jgi:hypothetical protein
MSSLALFLFVNGWVSGRGSPVFLSVARFRLTDCHLEPALSDREFIRGSRTGGSFPARSANSIAVKLLVPGEFAAQVSIPLNVESFDSAQDRPGTWNGFGVHCLIKKSWILGSADPLPRGARK